MRIIVSNTADRRWYQEAGGTTWGFGIEISHAAEILEDGGLAPQGFTVTLQIARWAVTFYTEAAALWDLPAGDLAHMGRVTWL